MFPLRWITREEALEATSEAAAEAAVLSSARTQCEPLRILICSENVMPQVNGIARRVSHYVDGLREIGCRVDLLSPESAGEVIPFTNPWNFTSKMFVIQPLHLMKLVLYKCSDYDVVHVVTPANISGCVLLAALRIGRLFRRQGTGSGAGPSLVISWHCNLYDYTTHIFPMPMVRLVRCFGLMGIGILPCLADRLLTPTRATEPQLTKLFGDRTGMYVSVIASIRSSLVFLDQPTVFFITF